MLGGPGLRVCSFAESKAGSQRQVASSDPPVTTLDHGYFKLSSYKHSKQGGWRKPPEWRFFETPEDCKKVVNVEEERSSHGAESKE